MTLVPATPTAPIQAQPRARTNSSKRPQPQRAAPTLIGVAIANDRSQPVVTERCRTLTKTVAANTTWSHQDRQPTTADRIAGQTRQRRGGTPGGTPDLSPVSTVMSTPSERRPATIRRRADLSSLDTNAGPFIRRHRSQTMATASARPSSDGTRMTQGERRHAGDERWRAEERRLPDKVQLDHPETGHCRRTATRRRAAARPSRARTRINHRCSQRPSSRATPAGHSRGPCTPSR